MINLREECLVFQQPARTLRDEFTGFASSALSISSQLSNFLPFRIERRDYTRLLASFPYLFLAGVIVFLFSSGGQVLSLTTAYIGVIFALLATSVSVLYVNKVIEPRWDAAGQAVSGEGDRKRAFARYARINRELTTLFVLMVGSLLMAALVPSESQRWRYLTNQQTKLIVWGFVALFMCLSSLGLAYGIIQRGVFKDVDHLIRRRNEYRGLVERFSMQPVVGSGGYGRNYVNDIRFSKYLDLLNNLEEQKLWYDLNHVFADDFEFYENPPEDNVLSSLWFKFRRSGAKTKPPYLAMRLKKDLPAQPRPIDFSIAPEESRIFLSIREDLKSHQREHARLVEEVRRLEQEVASMYQELIALKSDVTANEDLKRKTEEQFDTALNTVVMNREIDLMKFRASFAIGVVARNLLKDEGVLPGSPPENRDTGPRAQSPEEIRVKQAA